MLFCFLPFSLRLDVKDDVCMLSDSELAVNRYLSSDQPILPLLPGSKAPATRNGLKDAVPLKHFTGLLDAGDNYGIRLDGLCVVDFDAMDFTNDPEMRGFFDRCSGDATWAQRTGGKHRGIQFLYSAPGIASQVSKIKSISTGREYGEITSGPGHYIVGPGSVVEVAYQLVGAAAPKPMTDAVRAMRDWGRSKKTKLADLGNDLGSDVLPGATDRERMLRLTGKLREAGLSPRRAAQAAQRMQHWTPSILRNFNAQEPFLFDDLLDMAQSWQVTPEKKSSDDEDEDVKTITWAHIAKNPLPPVQHYCYELRLRVGAGPTLLTGHSGSKKTALLLHIGACLATGDPMFGTFAIRSRPSKVLFVSIDMPEEDAWRRIGHLPGTPSDDFLFVDWSRKGFDGVKFENLLLAHPGAFVLVDCYADVASGMPPRQNDYEGLSTRKLISDLRQAYLAAGSDGIITDHTTRPSEKNPKAATDNVIGSAQKRASIRSGLTMRVYTESEMKKIVSPIKNGAGVPVTYSIIESLKQGESGSVSPIHVAFIENVFVGPNGEVLGESHVPALITAPQLAPQKITVGTLDGKKTNRQIVLEQMIPGQKYTSTELALLTEIDTSNIVKILKNDKHIQVTKRDEGKGFVFERLISTQEAPSS